MRRVTVVVLMLLLAAPCALAEEKANVSEFRQIIEKSCTGCHDADRIEKAMQEGRNVTEILNKMQSMDDGPYLSARDKEVLGIFWGAPLKE